jgi:16S rRNA (guanine1516-N2)-methyltransferase
MIAVTDRARPLLATPLAVQPLLSAADESASWLLDTVDDELTLSRMGERSSGLSVNFSAGRMGYRLERVMHEPLIKACGLTRAEEPRRVLDATAGWGRDAGLLAMAGTQVVMLEAEPVLHSLLADGLRRAPEPLCKRLSLLYADSLEWLTETTEHFDLVYLDPMFPERRKSAAVKKDLQWLQRLGRATGPEEQIQLLQLARMVAPKVVVKRPAKAPDLAGETPHHRFTGKTVRFDVYE